MNQEIINRVANSGLITFNLEEYYPKGKRLMIDLKDWLFEGLVLKEKDFRKSISDCDVELENDLEDKEYLKILKFYLNQLNEENFDFVFYIAGVDIHFNDRLGKLKISDEGIKKRDEIVTENFFSKGIPLCGVLGGGYNKDAKKLVELHSYLHQSCAKLV